MSRSAFLVHGVVATGGLCVEGLSWLTDPAGGESHSYEGLVFVLSVVAVPWFAVIALYLLVASIPTSPRSPFIPLTREAK
jgi:hypothetical protein